MDAELNINLREDRVQSSYVRGLGNINRSSDGLITSTTTQFLRFGLNGHFNLAQLQQGRPRLRADEHPFYASLSAGYGFHWKLGKSYVEAGVEIDLRYQAFSRGAQNLSHVSVGLFGVFSRFSIPLGDSLFQVDSYGELMRLTYLAESSSTYTGVLFGEIGLAISLLLPISDKAFLGPQLGYTLDSAPRMVSFGKHGICMRH